MRTGLFLKCKDSREAWRKLGLGDLCDRMATFEHAGEVVQEILGANDEQKILASCLLWRCWLRRNKLNAGEKACTIAELIGQTRYWAKESETLSRQEKITAAEKQSCIGRSH